MSVFADSSALVKLYAQEEGSDDIRRVARYAISALARVEVPAALWRKHRMRTLDATTTRTLVTAFEDDYYGTLVTEPRFVSIAVSPATLHSAAELTEAHGLRAYDAVQLATAVAARRVEPACDTFAVFDRQLREAAAAEGFALLPSA